MFIVCYSVDSSDSVENVRSKWIPEVRHHCGDTVPILLVGTKIDRRAEAKVNDPKFLSRIHGLALAKEVKARKLVECSAFDGQNVTEVFEEAVRLVLYPAEKRKRKGKNCRIM